MSIRAMTWAMESAPDDLTPTQRHVLLVLADFVNDETLTAFPSVARLCRRTGLSTRSVQMSLRALEDAGIISTHIKAATGAGDRIIPHDRRPNLYRWTAFETLTEVQEMHLPPAGDAPREVHVVQGNHNKNRKGTSSSNSSDLASQVVEALRLRIRNAPLWLGRRAVPALEQGWTVSAIVDEITRDSTDGARSPSAVLASRLDDLATRPPKHPRKPRPAWCGGCDQETRHKETTDRTGRAVVIRCPDCHPEPQRSAS